MQTNLRRILAASALLFFPALAAHADEIFSPGLPATGTQYQECRIVNITAFSQTVSIQGIRSTGFPATALLTHTLAPGGSTALASTASALSMYCKFIVTGSVSGFRASIDVYDPTVTPPIVVVALPAY